MASNYALWLQLTPNSSKFLQMAPSGSQLLQISRRRPKRSVGVGVGVGLSFRSATGCLLLSIQPIRIAQQLTVSFDFMLTAGCFQCFILHSATKKYSLFKTCNKLPLLPHRYCNAKMVSLTDQI